MQKPPEHKYDLLERQFYPDVWKTMVCCILFNRTTRKQVESVIYDLFDRYQMASSLKHSDVDCLTSMLRPLGFQNRRVKTLIDFSRELDSLMSYGILSKFPYKVNLTLIELEELPGIGKYASDCYRIFFLRDRHFNPEDKALKNYLKFYGKLFTICPVCYKHLEVQDRCSYCSWKNITHEGE